MDQKRQVHLAAMAWHTNVPHPVNSIWNPMNQGNSNNGDPDTPLPSPYVHGVMVVGNGNWPGLHPTMGRPMDPRYAYGALPPPFPSVDTPADPGMLAIPARLGTASRIATGLFPNQNDAATAVDPVDYDADIASSGIGIGPGGAPRYTAAPYGLTAHMRAKMGEPGVAEGLATRRRRRR